MCAYYICVHPGLVANGFCVFVPFCIICALVYSYRCVCVCVYVCVVQRKRSHCNQQHAQSFIISSLLKHGLTSFISLVTKYCLFLFER